MRTLQPLLLILAFAGSITAGFAQTDPADLEAYQIVQEIRITMGEQNNPVKINTQSSTVTQTAKATKGINGERIILYNRNFLTDFNRSGNLKQRAYLIMAHEVAHHLNNDDFSTDRADQRQAMEQEADKFAGRLLFKLCIDPKSVAEVFKSLPADPSGVYLPVAQRGKFVMDGYNSEKKVYEKVGKDPCAGEKPEQPVSLQRTWNKMNKSEGVTARIFHDSIVFTYNIYPFNEHSFKPRFIVSEKARLAPKIEHFMWFDDPTTHGTEKKAVWYYKKDGFSYPEVFNGDQFGLAVFLDNKVPKQKKNWMWWVGGGLTVVGAVLLGTGIPDRISAQRSYNKYASVRSGNLYESINGQTRQDAYDEFNPLKKSAEWRIGFGAPCLGFGLGYLWDANHRRINLPKGLFLFEGTRK